MEKARISSYQLFALIMLFEHGMAMLLPMGVEAGREVWLANTLGMFGGLVMFLVFYLLFYLYPDVLPATYAQKILGKWLGGFVSFTFTLYFLYMASVNLRDLGEMLANVGYDQTPVEVQNLIFLLIVIYAVRKGIEVIARTGEIFFSILVLILASLLVLIFTTNIIDLKNIFPVLENGMKPVLKTVVTSTMYIPYGEVVAFAIIFPYVNNPKKVKIGFLAVFLSGLILGLFSLINLCVLGLELMSRSQYPLLSTIQTIHFEDYLARLDIFFMLILIISCFFRVTIFLYVAVVSIAELFKIEQTSRVIYPFAIVIYILSIFVVWNLIEHIHLNSKILPLPVYLPLQLILPAIVLGIAFLQKRREKKKNK